MTKVICRNLYFRFLLNKFTEVEWLSHLIGTFLSLFYIVRKFLPQSMTPFMLTSMPHESLCFSNSQLYWNFCWNYFHTKLHDKNISLISFILFLVIFVLYSQFPPCVSTLACCVITCCARYQLTFRIFLISKCSASVWITSLLLFLYRNTSFKNFSRNFI